MVWCTSCDRSFVSQHALEQHLEASPNHNYCSKCERDFNSWNALRTHYINSPIHYFCRGCDDDFDDDDELDDHIEENHWYCGNCEKFFESELGLREHYRQSPAHFYCPSCDKHFQNDNNLQQHLRSAIHVGRPFNCPGSGCGKSFPSIAALTLHLESGTCPSGITRKKLDKRVAEFDRQGLITDRLRITSESPYQVTDTYATDAAWNGSAYECYFCARGFRTLFALNQHLKSPVHESANYRCPHCQVQFGTLSGLVQHIESGECGVMKFGSTKRVVDELTTGLQNWKLLR
ncbi:hypothetical protein JAAARDRAFT_61237 [Jaapia argillacea MUCL 33604]|uniref:C2H2-type domain-containing protein n=1 Tax=Jaapia argillacea MUCL 33604 TaxID=933084 RepID=A0A067PQD9_9AGAM|nr:hypothetical protein JAAARDRAFT_61237 [Jaapia argillacea MUCL 33604]